MPKQPHRQSFRNMDAASSAPVPHDKEAASLLARLADLLARHPEFAEDAHAMIDILEKRAEILSELAAPSEATGSDIDDIFDRILADVRRGWPVRY